jgi:16S rRNA (guanine966-N2)-methyltransferase
VRITAGQYRGLTLLSPKDNKVRPTTDKIRQAIFNILQHNFDGVQDKAVLDLFCGTGALGLECLSRGAASAVFVDLDISLAKQNVIKMKADEQCQFIRSDFLKYKTKQMFDLVFLDPPYAMGLAQAALDKYSDQKTALFTVETEKSVHLKNVDIIDEKIYGDTKITFLKQKNQC